MKKTIAWILCILMMLALIPAAFADGNVLPPAEALSDDTVLVGVSGTFTEDHAAVLRELNRIRYLACYYGDPDPRNREHALALADTSGGEEPSDAVLAQENGDYVPAQWDSDLQRIAEIRAVEASLSFSHTRPNGMSCFTVEINGTGSFCECLASTYDAVYSLTMYRSERQDWIDGADAVTGHYTAMISPSRRYYGIAGFRDVSGYGASSLEARGTLGGSTTPIGRSGVYTQIAELPVSMFDGAAMNGNDAMKVGEAQTLEMLLKRGTKRTFTPYEPVAWQSSDPGILTVDGNGRVEALKSGTATVTATFAEQTATLEITVTTDGSAEPEDPEQPQERSGQCGDNVYWKLGDNGVMTVSGEGETWWFWDENPTFWEYRGEVKEIVFEDGVTGIGGYFLYDMYNLETMRISKTVRTMQEGNWGTPRLAVITVDPDSTHLTAIDNVLYSKNMRALCKYASQKPDTYYRIPDGVETVCEAAMYSNNLRTVVLPESIKLLEPVAISGKNLTDVYFRGLPPEDGGACNDVLGDPDLITVWYPDWLRDAWAPNGETMMDIYRIEPYYSPVQQIELNAEDVGCKGETPYVVYDGKAHTPRFTVLDRNGSVVDESEYTVTYRDNTAPGTAYIDVQWKEGGPVVTQFFKIYLPETTEMYVENRADGVRITWKPVEGAKGYVIYRRAWNLTSAGWTGFARWYNTTETTWTDTKVYAGTRYQYGVKAYFSDPMDNYNLGLVGPLKTTVRITSRTLLGVDAGEKQMTVRWSGSKYFTGYQIRYSTDPTFKTGSVAFKVARPDAYRNTVKNLVSGTTYYVQVRSYHEFDGMTYFGEWSEALSCTVR